MRKVLRFIGKLIKWVLILAILGVLIFGGFTFYQGKQLYEEVIAEKSIEDRVVEQQANPDYVILDQISGDFLNAVISVEDRNFYSHGAINPSSMIRALITNIKEKSFVEGGSTITQQLAKNLCFSQEKKLSRKAAEIFAAYDLEKIYSKDQILELYVNLNYYGDGFYGVGPACRGYFSKEPLYMTAGEATLLAGLPQAPSAYALSTHADRAYERQEEVVDSMIDNGYITEDEGELILMESDHSRNYSGTETLTNSYIAGSEENLNSVGDGVYQ